MLLPEPGADLWGPAVVFLGPPMWGKSPGQLLLLLGLVADLTARTMGGKLLGVLHCPSCRRLEPRRRCLKEHQRRNPSCRLQQQTRN